MEDSMKATSAHFSGLLLEDQPSTTSTVIDAQKEPFVIGVAGGTAAGKTTVCNMIISQLRDQRVALVNQDLFYRVLNEEELKHARDYNFDHPDSFDMECLLDCMTMLKQRKSVDIPSFNHKLHQRCAPVRKVNSSDVIILEGILVFHDPRLCELMNMKIFVDTDADVRLGRRIRRNRVQDQDMRSFLDKYYKFVKPAYDEFISPSKKHADIIVPHGGDNHVAINLVVQHIRVKLGEHDLCKIYPNLYVINSSFQRKGMHTLQYRNETSKRDFVSYADQLIRVVVEHGLGHLSFTEKKVISPTGSLHIGADFCETLCGVSIIRSGESMENALRECCKGIKIGKIFIHGDGDNGNKLINENLPKDISNCHLLLLDPVLATGNSAVQAIQLLLEKGVQESNIIFLNLISAPQGIHMVCKKFPMLKIVTLEIDMALNEEFRVVPGIGEFGERKFGTEDGTQTALRSTPDANETDSSV
ncbi:uridine kinase-like protein 4 isoform X1 [Cryptomeria japonica]|uniref:uridine kinase-like protein 4 isoform X1 n=2 Tax=Cryptomeria japonica TaxID=3369 RepID=UPI0027DA5336|nr:uridine kinase-like protein 4 isoform X1 [Cryptomeria japonica]